MRSRIGLVLIVLVAASALLGVVAWLQAGGDAVTVARDNVEREAMGVRSRRPAAGRGEPVRTHL